MRVVRLTGIGFGKDDVVWLWHVALWELGASYVHHGLRWFLCFLCIFVSCALATPDLTRSLEYHLFLQAYDWHFSIASGY